jgi:hypothetical protein
MFNLPADGYIVYAGLALGVVLLVGVIFFFMRRRKALPPPPEDDGVTIGSLPTPVGGAEEDEGEEIPA